MLDGQLKNSESILNRLAKGFSEKEIEENDEKYDRPKKAAFDTSLLDEESNL